MVFFTNQESFPWNLLRFCCVGLLSKTVNSKIKSHREGNSSSLEVTGFKVHGGSL